MGTAPFIFLGKSSFPVTKLEKTDVTPSFKALYFHFFIYKT